MTDEQFIILIDKLDSLEKTIQTSVLMLVKSMDNAGVGTKMNPRKNEDLIREFGDLKKLY